MAQDSQKLDDNAEYFPAGQLKHWFEEVAENVPAAHVPVTWERPAVAQ